jgi:hypothetical protein
MLDHVKHVDGWMTLVYHAYDPTSKSWRIDFIFDIFVLCKGESL